MENSDGGSSAGSDRGGLITARGTGDGLVLRVDGRVEPAVLKQAMREFVSARRSFLAGNDVILEWVGGLPEDNLVDELRSDLSADFQVTVKSSKLRSMERKIESEPTVLPDRVEISPPSLFDGIEAMRFDDTLSSDEESGGVEVKNAQFDSDLWDEPDARLFYGPLRSGQKLETEHSLVIMGDVNSGAEIVAGGDIVVLGSLRGVAHAGAYDETGGGRIIFALNLQPTQLRIGSVISRGSTDRGQQPEIARVDGTVIVVERYHPRTWNKGK